uniref:Uncharacterized protein n=1 Tax=Anguilla anguilla TaxID=7936 RepID=A0A0E9UL35_ANGAN
MVSQSENRDNLILKQVFLMLSWRCDGLTAR